MQEGHPASIPIFFRIFFLGGTDKMTAVDVSMDRKKDEKGGLSAATRRVTTENAPFSDFCETRKDQSGVLSVPPSLSYSRYPGLFFGEKSAIFPPVAEISQNAAEKKRTGTDDGHGAFG